MENKIIKIPPRNPEGINGKMRAGHVALRTTDYDGIINWYKEKLGFRLLHEWTVGALKLAYLAPANDDDFWLEVITGAVTGQAWDPAMPIVSGYQHWCLDVESVDETVEAVRQRGVKVLREPFNIPGAGKRACYIADLHDNVIEFTENV